MLIPVIMSGGAGTRLWPLSRELFPKQLLPLVGDNTMLQDTVLRLEGIETGAPVVVCNEAHRFLVAEQLRQIDTPAEAIVLEPKGRNTAPAVAIAALVAAEAFADEDPVLLVLPADHVIADPAAFRDVVKAGHEKAKEGGLVTFGVVAKTPETGYGYIKAASKEPGVQPVAGFVEKPDLDTANNYVASGDYYWNSGMFMFTAGTYLAELERFAPEMTARCKGAVAGRTTDLDFTRLDVDEFLACPSDSIDYAVMEKTDSAFVIPLDAGWSDVGSWSSLHDASNRDDKGNVAVGDVIAENTENSYLHSSSRLVATVGLKDHVVVETKDAVLVAHRDQVQDVKAVVNRLKSDERYECETGREVYRPWGSCDRVDHGDGFRVNRLIVRPGAALSLQLHHRRAEHWVVVSGKALITRNGEEFLLEKNQSTFIPVETKHRIANPGPDPVHIIEVQSGDYLGEDDIVRFEDSYGRE